MCNYVFEQTLLSSTFLICSSFVNNAVAGQFAKAISNSLARSPLRPFASYDFTTFRLARLCAASPRTPLKRFSSFALTACYGSTAKGGLLEDTS
jgi:hypothetical protein